MERHKPRPIGNVNPRSEAMSAEGNRNRTGEQREHAVVVRPLTLEQLILLLPSAQTPETIVTLNLSGRGISLMPTQLAFLKNVRKLDLSNNALQDLSPISKMLNLTQLKLARNRLVTIRELKGLDRLSVLDISHNEVASLDGAEALPALVALIAPDNHISDVTALASCKKLETLILSRNPIRPEALKPLVESSVSGTLRKLSLSHCGLTALPSLNMPLLNELRLNDNKLQEFAPETAFRSLKLLDVANNELNSLASLRPFAVFIQQLALHGNPVLQDDDNPTATATPLAMQRIIGHMFKSLKLLDGKSFAVPSPAELREDRKRRAAGLAEPVVQASTAASTDAAKDVVYEGPLPELPAKNYVRTTKVHRVDELSLPKQTQRTPSSPAPKKSAGPPPTVGTLTGSEALQVLRSAANTTVGGW